MTTKTLSRRSLLRGGAAFAGSLAAQTALPAWMPRFAFAPYQQGARGDVLVSIFLRGGAAVSYTHLTLPTNREV